MTSLVFYSRGWRDSKKDWLNRGQWPICTLLAVARLASRKNIRGSMVSALREWSQMIFSQCFSFSPTIDAPRIIQKDNLFPLCFIEIIDWSICFSCSMTMFIFVNLLPVVICPYFISSFYLFHIFCVVVSSPLFSFLMVVFPVCRMARKYRIPQNDIPCPSHSIMFFSILFSVCSNYSRMLSSIDFLVGAQLFFVNFVLYFSCLGSFFLVDLVRCSHACANFFRILSPILRNLAKVFFPMFEVSFGFLRRSAHLADVFVPSFSCFVDMKFFNRLCDVTMNTRLTHRAPLIQAMRGYRACGKDKSPQLVTSAREALPGIYKYTINYEKCKGIFA